MEPWREELYHSSGPWKKHKYIKKVGNKYYYSTKQGASGEINATYKREYTDSPSAVALAKDVHETAANKYARGVNLKADMINAVGMHNVKRKDNGNMNHPDVRKHIDEQNELKAKERMERKAAESAVPTLIQKKVQSSKKLRKIWGKKLKSITYSGHF